jgi:hypothetical protein
LIVRGLKITAVAALLVVLGLAGTWASRQFGTDDRALASPAPSRPPRWT